MAEAIGVGEHEVEVVKGTKNEYEFRAELLSALFNSLQGEEVSFPASMVKDTEVYRKGILNALNVEYTGDDVKHTPVFRSKVIDGVKNMSGGGGGGGGTATVQITANTGRGVDVWGPVISNNIIMTDKNENHLWHIDVGSSDTFTVPLATGGMQLFVGGIPDETEPVITGGGTFDIDNWCFIITSDCTITV